jgi:hypothetical protein
MKFFHQFISLYIDGFKNPGILGKRLWMIIIIKLFIIFFVLKLFFFPDFLKKNFSTEKERSEHILNELTIHKNE